MESEQVRQIQVQEEKQEPATIRQVHYIEVLAKDMGFQINPQNMTKYEATKKIELLKTMLKMYNSQRNKEQEVKLAMVKKLIYKKWVAHDRAINKQTEKLFIQEVYYINQLFDNIDQLILSEQAA
jgi:aspartyl aminopeptidase